MFPFCYRSLAVSVVRFLKMPGLRERLRAIFTVEPVLFFFMTSTFIFVPAFQQLVIAKVCNEMYPNKTVCADSIQIKGDVEIQRQSSYILLAYTGMLSLVSIPPAMILGSWSDQGGRKLGMVLPSLLALVSSSVFIAMAVVESASAYWGVAAALVSGLSGSHVSVFLSCFSYVADVADASSRTRRMALAESMVFVGGTAGFLLSGFLLTRFGFVATFGVCCAFHVLSVLYVLLWLPSPDRTTQTLLADSQEEAGSVPLGLSVLTYAGRSFKTMFRERRDGEKHKLLLLMICTFLNNLIAMGDQAVLLLYLTYTPREFTTEMYGVFNSARMLLFGFALMGLFPLLLRCFGEMTLAKMSAFLRTVSCVLMAFSTNTWMVFLAAVVGTPSGIPQAVTRSLSSAIVDPNEQGAMFSFMASMEALCLLVAAMLFNGLYPLTLTSFPGMVFIMMAGFAFIILIFIQ
ncbi:proton-coupled folate transporter isoform X2 [Anguilla rostrata]